MCFLSCLIFSLSIKGSLVPFAFRANTKILRCETSLELSKWPTSNSGLEFVIWNHSFINWLIWIFNMIFTFDLSRSSSKTSRRKFWGKPPSKPASHFTTKNGLGLASLSTFLTTRHPVKGPGRPVGTILKAQGSSWRPTAFCPAQKSIP